MQQGVLAVHCFDRILKASTGKLIGQSFRRIANSVAAFQSAVFAQQNDVFAFSLFGCAGDALCSPIIRRQKSDDAMLPQPIVAP